MKTFYTCYTNVHSVMLIKDNGMIPYYMQKLGYYDAHYVSYIPDGADDDFVKHVDGLTLHHIDHVFTKNEEYTWHSPVLRPQRDMMKYIWKNATKIDVLNLYFIKTSILYSILYKLRNPRGKCYIKADVNILSLPQKTSLIGKVKIQLFRIFLEHIPTLISVETTAAERVFQSLFHLKSDKLIYIPNGVNDLWLKSHISIRPYSAKENIIVTVARFGAKSKNTQFLLDVCKKIKWQGDWMLIAIGGILPEYEHQIREFYEHYPLMSDRVKFLGLISDRKVLFDWYNRAKIFVMTSIYESFGISFVEAMSMGNYIVSTPLVPLNDFIHEGTGRSCQTVDEMSKTLEELMGHDELLEKAYPEIIKKSKHFYWSSIVKRLYGALQ